MKLRLRWFRDGNDEGKGDQPPDRGSDEQGGGEGYSGKERALAAFFSFAQWLQHKGQPLLNRLDWALLRNIIVVLAFSFVIASSVSTLATNSAINLAFNQKNGKSVDNFVSFSPLAVPKADVPASEIKKNILSRNIFNISGALPPDDEESKVTRTKDLDFASVPCAQEAMPVEVIGTLYTGDPFKSFVTVKDPKVEDADIYKSGDLVIEHEDYEVYSVGRGRVEFRKGDQKICVFAKGLGEDQKTSGPVNPAAVSPENVESMEFDSTFLANEIGPGYANILNAAKLIPELEDGKMIGFKLLSIVPGSLFDRMKLQNGDVVTEVNGVSMRDPSQGFKIYQALQEEREINIKIVRGGAPMIRKVRVK